VPRLVHALAFHFPPLLPGADLPGLVAAALDDLGPSAVHESGSDVEPTWRIFLADAARLDDSAADLSAAFGPAGCRVEIVAIEDEDWAARTQAHLTRITVGAITVAPPWDVPATVDPDRHLVVIPPSMGFGTGHHESTRLCLGLLQAVPVAGRRVLDIGTGSGVLAIAALRLGASDVEGVDSDEDAVRSARDSVSVNGLTGRLALRVADFRVEPLAPADIVIANLTGALLVASARILVGLTRPGGTLLLSGLQRHETDAVASTFAAFATETHRASEGDWDALGLLRPAHRQ
jgi:ribosomal protein L11 methyltransferase